ncbi:TPA: hypothetical protein JBG74_00590 [Legionella pneumophila]|uniref:Uncharacterized protein n=2 Tax=Legionella pneumophila TaxID=446 RepID=Q5ZUJ6_LEGPH|nr:hypothetical protein lpg1802 [Legionella pneumophila subsp. pneumophila str. Philadelphia 1]AEW52003.1 hypothetical protein lp12_1741 [Legionella pneumophila subsp. pneumophila ATCC 43290]PNL77840.1 hypothetical protein A6J41_007885 [Legionella pneumophila subsp. pneumophila]PPK33021.1 hypothetical protein C3927_08260 [Legionella pneumophila]OOD07598.1 hypothetical protein BWO97_06190 [Legionella pneumophila subsp. pneumophila ATCC 43290]
MSDCLYIFILPRYQAKNQGLKFKLTTPSFLNKWLFHVAYNKRLIISYRMLLLFSNTLRLLFAARSHLCDNFVLAHIIIWNKLWKKINKKHYQRRFRKLNANLAKGL